MSATGAISVVSAQDNRSSVLAGVLVVDLTSFLAGPYCTQILGDMGATIVKIEPPSGDSSRTVPPHYVGGDSAYFLCANRNKHSIVLDLRKPEGMDVLRELVAKADVLVENYRPGVLQRLGLTYEQARETNPKLVWCAISGFGQDGPYRDRPAYDMIVQAMSGGMSMTGETGGGAVRAGIPLGDISAGMYGTIGVLGALHEVARSGKGSQIDVAMLDCQVAMLTYQASYHLNAGVVPGRQGRGHDSIPTYRAFTAADGRDVLITANTEKMWQALCGVLEHPEWKIDERFLVNRDRNHNREVLIPMLEQTFATRTAAQWLERLLAAQIPAAPVNDLAEVFADPHVHHRGMVLGVQGMAQGQSARVAGNPLHMEGANGTHRYPPALGADGALVLEKILTLSPERLQQLTACGAWVPASQARAVPV